VRSYGDTELYRKALRKRGVWVEPLFAEAKDWHGARRFRSRGLDKVNAEALLIAAGQNIKRLLTFGKRGPRRPAQMAALRQPAPDPYGFCSVRKHRKRCSRHPVRVFQHPGAFQATRRISLQLMCRSPPPAAPPHALSVNTDARATNKPAVKMMVNRRRNVLQHRATKLGLRVRLPTRDWMVPPARPWSRPTRTKQTPRARSPPAYSCRSFWVIDHT
jgi:DDE family transposase